MENLKKPSKTRGESWKFQWMRPCFAKGTKKRSSFQETEATSCESNKIPKPKHACIVDAHESTRQRLEPSLPKDHEDHIAGKGYNSMTRFFLVHKFIPVPQAMEIPGAKAAVDKEWKKLQTIPARQWDKVKRWTRRLFWKHKETKRCYNGGHLSSQKCGVDTQNSEVWRVESCSEVTL